MTTTVVMKYTVGEIRAAGLEARWTRTRNGAPIIVARKPGSTRWYCVDKHMWKRAANVGIAEAFDEHTVLGDIFSIKL